MQHKSVCVSYKFHRIFYVYGIQQKLISLCIFFKPLLTVPPSPVKTSPPSPTFSHIQRPVNRKSNKQSAPNLMPFSAVPTVPIVMNGEMVRNGVEMTKMVGF